MVLNFSMSSLSFTIFFLLFQFALVISLFDLLSLCTYLLDQCSLLMCFEKYPAYGRHQNFRPMQIVAPGLHKDGNGGNMFPANVRFWQPLLTSPLK